MPTSTDSTPQFEEKSKKRAEIQRSREWLIEVWRAGHSLRSIPAPPHGVLDTMQASLDSLAAEQTHADVPQATSYPVPTNPWIVINDDTIEEVFQTKAEADAYTQGAYVFYEFPTLEVIDLHEWRRRQQALRDLAVAPDSQSTPQHVAPESSEPNTIPVQRIEHVRIDQKDHEGLVSLLQELVGRHPDWTLADTQVLAEALDAALRTTGELHAVSIAQVGPNSR